MCRTEDGIPDKLITDDVIPLAASGPSSPGERSAEKLRLSFTSHLMEGGVTLLHVMLAVLPKGTANWLEPWHADGRGEEFVQWVPYSAHHHAHTQ